MGTIEIRNLSFAYRDRGRDYPVLNQLNLEVSQGEFVCLIGRSGCGKSTLLNILAGLLPVEQGRVAVDEEPVSGPGKGRAVVFQHYSLFPWMTAYKNVLFGITQMRKGIPKQEAREIAEKHLRQVGMWEYRDCYPYQLSGGMQQRTAIARALATDAGILLLDEPFGALDVKMRKELQELMKGLWSDGEGRRTALFVTHDIEEAVFLGERVLFMEDGRIGFDMKPSGDKTADKEKLSALFYQGQEDPNEAVLQ